MFSLTRLYRRNGHHVSRGAGAGRAIVSLTAAVLALSTAFMPSLALSRSAVSAPSGVCRACHTKHPLTASNPGNAVHTSARAGRLVQNTKTLTFVNLGTRGSGIGSVGELQTAGDGTITGKVRSARLLFRDARGMRLACELGKYLPKGADLVMGTKTYLLSKSGVAWRMRNVVSINGMAVSGNVFVAEQFVEKNSPPVKTFLAQGIKPADIAEHSAKRASRKMTEREPSEKMSLTIKDERISFTATERCGGFTIVHSFKGTSRITVHEAYLQAYPSASFQEIFSVPLEEVRNNIARYIRGLDGTMELTLLALAGEDIMPLFANKAARQLPPPDSRIVTEMKLAERGDAGRVYFRFSSGEWTALDDELLTKIVRSEPVAAYAEVNSKRP